MDDLGVAFAEIEIGQFDGNMAKTMLERRKRGEGRGARGATLLKATVT